MSYILLYAGIIGLSLGIFGSGGSIMTVPVLIYLVGQPDKIAIASSLAIVAAISFGGSILNIFNRRVSYQHLIWFGLPGMLGTYFGAWGGTLVNSKIQLSIFVILMLIAAKLMWSGRGKFLAETKQSKIKIVINGTVVGAITGFVGVGGGFLIVPALVILGGLTMPLAIATSLLIISMQSLVGFSKYYQIFSEQHIIFDWAVIGWMIFGGIAGSYVGIWLSNKLPKDIMQKSFSIFLLLMGIFILYRSVI
ncbi:sulfite exporter TauE/SafE family protein [Aeromonas salmonicida]|uniref:sulfite exporter TauE/SafE family protein n=1 Tax=Aeromonas salmonicida TaxID=645 RepID=UPI0039A5B004